MNRFAYSRAESLAQALAALREPNTVAKAGGVDLLDLMKEGLISPARLVDLSALDGMRYLRFDMTGGLRIGALTTLAEIEADPRVRMSFPALAEAAAHAATPQIRAMATLGGNLAQRPRCWYFRSIDFQCRKKGGAICFAHDGENQLHAISGNQLCAAVHGSTLATALLAYGARLFLEGVEPYELALEKFFMRPEEDVTREHRLRPGELITEVRLSPPPPGARAAYTKQGERESYDWPIADVAVVIEPDGRACKSAAIALGSYAPVPVRAAAAEALVRGKVIDEAVARAAAKAALDGATPLAKNGYKREVFDAVIRRTILAAARGGS